MNLLAMIGPALHLGTWALVWTLGAAGLVPAALASVGGHPAVHHARRAVGVQGGLWVLGRGLRAVLPPVDAWLEPYPWLDVVRVSGMWTAAEPSWAGGSLWALEAAAGGSVAVAWVGALLVSGPWLAWSARGAVPDSDDLAAVGRSEARGLAAWWGVGLATWLGAAAASLVLPSAAGHALVRGVSWLWLPWTAGLMVRTAVVAPRLGMAAGWLRRLPWVRP